MQVTFTVWPLGRRARYGLGMVFFVLVALIGAVACSTAPASQRQDRANTEDQQSIYARNQPVPRFEYSQTRDTLIQIYKLGNEARRTYTVIHATGTGEPVFSCPSRGYAVAADTQLTNPLQPGYPNIHETYVIEQPEPNGVYSSKNTTGTYILCVRQDGNVVPVYTELSVSTFPYEVEQVPGTNQVRDAGKASSSTIQVRTQPGDPIVPAPAAPSPSPALR